MDSDFHRDNFTVFDRTLQKTHRWIKQIMRQSGCLHPQQAYRALRAVLHTLREHLTLEETAHLGAQLPMLIRGVFYESWVPRGKPLREPHLDQFMFRIESQLMEDPTMDPWQVEALTAAVFHVLAEHISPGELEDVRDILPRELKALLAA